MPLIRLPAGVSLTPALLKQIIEKCGTCNPCGGSASGSSNSAHGNPGCCGNAPCVDDEGAIIHGVPRHDVSFQINGCDIPCASASGWAISPGVSACIESSNSDNFDAEPACPLMAESPGTNGEGPECAGGWLNDGGSSGSLYAASNPGIGDPTPYDETQDSCFVTVGFGCWDDGSGGTVPPCESRQFFCASMQFTQGMTHGVLPDTTMTVPDRGNGTHLYNYTAIPRLDGVVVGASPAQTNPNCAFQFHKDVLGFSIASCSPFIFEVTDVEPWISNRNDGVVFSSYSAGTYGGEPVYFYDYTTVPLKTCEPTISATWTQICIPCEEE